MTTKANLEAVKPQETEEIKTKKEMILSVYNSGTTEIEAIAAVTGASPSYVGSVLHNEGLIDNYFDLYTSTAYPMNVYSKHFVGKLGFRDAETARRSVRTLERTYRYFDREEDRAGQHHTLEMGLLMLNRARWTGKAEEAEIYRLWLADKLSRPLFKQAKDNVVQFPQVKKQERAEDLEEKRAA